VRARDGYIANGQDQLAVVPGAAHGLEANQRRRPLAVVVADVQGEGDHGATWLSSFE